MRTAAGALAGILAAGALTAIDEEVRAVYEEATVKHHPELVADLGYGTREHFKKKFRAVERAYRMLAASLANQQAGGAGHSTCPCSCPGLLPTPRRDYPPRIPR